MNKPVIIIGNGGHASVLTEILRIQQREIIGYTAPLKACPFLNLKYLGTDEAIDDFKADEVELAMGLGTIHASVNRKNIYEQFILKGFKFASIIHQSAIITPSTRLAQGVQIMAGVILQSNVSIGENAIINTGSIIDHDCKVGKHVHIAPGSTLSGEVQVDEGCHIGVGTSIIQGIQIGKDTTIGAGSVVVKNIGAGKKAYGIPAKEV